MTTGRQVQIQTIDIARDFTRFPAGRFRKDGHFSGERFRDELLVPRLERGERVMIRLDGTIGYGSSFLEEAFGGLVRKGFNPSVIEKLVLLESSDQSLTSEIHGYITSTRH